MILIPQSWQVSHIEKCPRFKWVLCWRKWVQGSRALPCLLGLFHGVQTYLCPGIGLHCSRQINLGMTLKATRHEVDKIKLHQTLNFCIVNNQQKQEDTCKLFIWKGGKWKLYKVLKNHQKEKNLKWSQIMNKWHQYAFFKCVQIQEKLLDSSNNLGNEN